MNNITIGAKVAIKATDDQGIVVNVNNGLNYPYLVFLVNVCDTSRFKEEEIELIEPASKVIVAEDVPCLTRSYNVGNSDYCKHKIQPWDIWLEYNLNPWDADIVKRILRTKEEVGLSKAMARKLDYEKIIHICQERIRQINEGRE